MQRNQLTPKQWAKLKSIKVNKPRLLWNSKKAGTHIKKRDGELT